MQTPFTPVHDLSQRTDPSRLVKAAALIASIAVAASAGETHCQPRGIMTSDLAAREQDIHWPVGFEPEHADLFAHNEVHVNASCETVWQRIIDVRSWPTWYANSQDVSLIGDAKTLGPDVRWKWTTFGLTIESHVQDFVTGQRLSWFGGAPGEAPAFYHAWLLKPVDGGCRVIMDEVGMGPGAVAFREADEGRMHRGHALWLAALQWQSEGR